MLDSQSEVISVVFRGTDTLITTHKDGLVSLYVLENVVENYLIRLHVHY